ncbi:MBL fold metallo-hydrolase RNA specificity domain-containing protein [Nannocystaceae bacterium ST9]
MSAPTLGFYGATETVTGSKFLLTSDRHRVLIDCGLFQGYKQIRQRNWQPLPFAAKHVDACVLTHAHIDHSGALPLLTNQGFAGTIHATSGTAALCRILLPDAARLQEQDAEYANRKGFARHSPALPLYDEHDAQRALERLEPHPFDREFAPAKGFTASFSRAGHILGAASVHVQMGARSVLFSGDLGRPNDPLIRAPTPRRPSDYVVIESTYGNRRHDSEDPTDALARVIDRTIARGGSVIVPAFSVGRTQSLLLLLARLRESGRLAHVPIYLDSPMAIAATELYREHRDTHRLDARECERMCAIAHYVREVEDSKQLDRLDHPIILISASGMATGGRVVHHLRRFLPDARNTILLTGYQAGGTRGAKLLAGTESLRIHGEWVAVHAEIASLDMLSAHADQDELVAWLRTSDHAPRKLFIVHGELEAAEHLRVRITDELGWECVVPEYRDEVGL